MSTTIEQTEDHGIAEQQADAHESNERELFAHERKLMFVSRRVDLRLTKVARYPERGPLGQKVGETKGEAVKFVDGKLWVPAEEGTVTLDDGRSIDAEEIRDWLAAHPLNGDRFEGFWQVELSAPAPTREELEALMRAATDPDLEAGLARLQEIIETEQSGWAREDILAVAGQALERLEAIKTTINAGGQT